MCDVSGSPDPDDDFLLAAAHAAQAEALVTGDKSGLLALEKHGVSAIVTVQAFLELFDRR